MRPRTRLFSTRPLAINEDWSGRQYEHCSVRKLSELCPDANDNRPIGGRRSRATRQPGERRVRLDDTVKLEEARERAARRGGLVWHYTSLDTLKLILESNSFLATEVSFQNDIRETETADAVVGGVLSDMMNDQKTELFARRSLRALDEVDRGFLSGQWTEEQILKTARFILCASEEPDSLYAWRTYGGTGIGCAIGLDPSVPLGVVGRPETDRQPTSEGWLPAMYGAKKPRKLAERLFRDLAADWNAQWAQTQDPPFVWGMFDIEYEQVPNARASVRARAKDASFEDEREHRVTITDNLNPSMITFTASSMGPRPHLRLAVADQWGATVPSVAEAPKLPIRAIRLGPSAPPIATKSAEWMLVAHGYVLDGYPGEPEFQGPQDWSKAVLITQSAHPYRTT